MLGSISSWILGSVPSVSTPHQPQGLSCLPDFAQAVVEKLRVDVNSLPLRPPGIARIKGSFRLYLESMPKHLESFSANEPSHSSGQERILAVLDCLEGICQWPSPYGQARRRNGVFDPKQYPALKSLLQPHCSATLAITSFAAARVRRDAVASRLWEGLVDSFDHLTGPEDELKEPGDEPKGPDLSELKNTTTSKEDFDDNQSFIVQLYSALSEHFKSASCRYQRKSITINLRLNWWYKEVAENEDILWFSLFFLNNKDNSRENSKASCQWQDVQICVPKFQRVIIQQPSEVNQSNIAEGSGAMNTSDLHDTDGSSSSSSSADDDDKFCWILEAPIAAQHKFSYSTDFAFQSSCQPERPFLRTSSSVPLSRLVGAKKLNAEMKAFLSFHLMRTIWQYYESNWIRDDWSKESVHFMFDEKVGVPKIAVPKVVSVHEPFLQTRLETIHPESGVEPKDNQPSKQRRKQLHRLQKKTRTHPYPKLLALGIILLEIELDRDFQEFGTPDCHDPDVVNVRHSIGANILKNGDIWPPKGIYKCIKQAIEICIKPDTGVLGNNEKRMRWIFFEEVVGPLEAFLSQAYDDSQGMNTIELCDNTSTSLEGPASHSNEDCMRDVTHQAHEVAEEELQPSYATMEAIVMASSISMGNQNSGFQAGIINGPVRTEIHHNLPERPKSAAIPDSATTAYSPRTHEDYQIGVICALATEKAAVAAMLDETHPRLKKEMGDDNEYTLGRIGVHNVVIACLPAGMIGNGPAAIVAKDMQRSFPIKFGLMVGVGGGVWSKKDDIRLGDVVISQPTGAHGGVVQWDFGKMGKDGKFRRTGSLDKPPPVLLHALVELQTFDETDGVDLEESLALMIQNKPRMAQKYQHQGIKNDVLFNADYDHEGDEMCDECDTNSIVQRPVREDTAPRIHYGNIASGNEVMKHGTTRDIIAKEEGVICFEMEAAGLMDNFRCLVIRGICDYADSHKNKIWQPYAAATAAALARALLSFVDEQEVIRMSRE